MATSSDQPIPASGLTVIVCPDDPDIDIVFVHGFTGHPYTTWLDKSAPATTGKKLSSRDRIRMKFSKSSSSTSASSSQQPPELPPSSGQYWPRALVPTVLPKARVLTYGYDTHIRHSLGPPGSQSSVYDIGGDFLLELEAKRQPGGRSILFIAHSLGGIIVKEMLRRSWRSRQPHLKDVCNSTAGIVFFGTPHGGADPRRFLHRVAERAFRAVGAEPNASIVSSLLPSSERLAELRDEFPPIVAERNWLIQSFQEDVGVRLLGGKVVDDVSSCLNLPTEKKQHIGRNHMDMCRFSGPGDVEFQKVAAVLRRMSSHALAASLASQPLDVVEVPEPLTINKLELPDSQRKLIRAALAFGQMDARFHDIAAQHPKTCTWLPEHEACLDWLDDNKLLEHSGFLWIKGKPGAGKSTLMKYLIRRFRGTVPGHEPSLAEGEQAAVISFFFNRRGSELEQSTLGLYRCVLLQLLEHFHSCWELFSSDANQTEEQEVLLQTSEERLKYLILASAERIQGGKAIIFIDGLDECEEDQIRDMVSFFETLAEAATTNMATFRFCFASRHYPAISLRRGRVVKLDDQEGHTTDIKVYVDSTLNVGQGPAATAILEEVLRKSQGIFMWVVLVVRILNKKYDKGRLNALRETLEALPPDLHELFRDIVKMESDGIEEVLLCLQWILFAKTALSPVELYYAIQSGLPAGISDLDQVLDMVDKESVDRYILDASRGLAEITKQETVQLIHESVGEFLQKDGLSHLTCQASSSTPGASHERLKTCCMNVIIAAWRNIQTTPPRLAKSSGRLAAARQHEARKKRLGRKHPILLRALAEVLYHADKAQGLGHPQTRFLGSFSIPRWLSLCNLYKRFIEPKVIRKIRTFIVPAKTNERRLELICAAFDYPHLYTILWDAKVRFFGPFEAVRRQQHTTLICIIAYSNVEMLLTIFRLSLDSLVSLNVFPALQQHCKRLFSHSELTNEENNRLKTVAKPSKGHHPVEFTEFRTRARYEYMMAYYIMLIECASRRRDGREETIDAMQLFKH